MRSSEANFYVALLKKKKRKKTESLVMGKRNRAVFSGKQAGREVEKEVKTRKERKRPRAEEDERECRGDIW